MDINATLFAEMFWFLLFVLFTMKYVWPPLQKNLQARKEQIADGLAAAEKGQRELELAQHKKRQELEAAKLQAAQIIEQARIRGGEMVDQSRVQARQESEHLLEAAQAEIERSYKKARMELQQEVSTLAIAVAEKLLKHHLDAANNQALIDGFIEQLSAKGAPANG